MLHVAGNAFSNNHGNLEPEFLTAGAGILALYASYKGLAKRGKYVQFLLFLNSKSITNI